MSRGFGPFGKIQEAIKQAQQVRDNAQKLQEELEQLAIVGEAGNGLVKVTLNGNQEPIGISLDPALFQKARTRSGQHSELTSAKRQYG